MTAFPIAMVLGAALAELLRSMRGPAWLDGASRWCMILGRASAAITAPLGWAFAAEHERSQLLEIHRWLGTAAGSGAVVLLILSEIARRRPGGALVLFRTVLFLAVPLVIATGFFGGAMIYGTHEYEWTRLAGHELDEAPEHAQPGSQPTSNPSASGVATVVTMTDDDTFEPDKLTIRAGTAVRWINPSHHTHTVTDDPKVASDPKDVSRPNGAAPFNSGKVRPGGKFEHMFTVPGVYKYVCEPHEDMEMKGQITVEAAH
jgi:plastocyanin